MPSIQLKDDNKPTVRIDLTEEELLRIMRGEVIQSPYDCILIGKSSK
jgi:hypothetical protein